MRNRRVIPGITIPREKPQEPKIVSNTIPKCMRCVYFLGIGTINSRDLVKCSSLVFRSRARYSLENMKYVVRPVVQHNEDCEAFKDRNECLNREDFDYPELAGQAGFDILAIGGVDGSTMFQVVSDPAMPPIPVAPAQPQNQTCEGCIERNAAGTDENGRLIIYCDLNVAWRENRRCEDYHTTEHYYTTELVVSSPEQSQQTCEGCYFAGRISERQRQCMMRGAWVPDRMCSEFHRR